ncbi:MAG TPA: metallophosphoesterase family protein [Coriobacteriia bacterium]|nr:metallophosphoesterase family protein [Coriobacteriia bacterium]
MRLDPPALIGVVADTHGELDPRIIRVFEGVDLIVHAGDVGSRRVLLDLESLAPVVAVAGNMDRGELAAILPDRASFRIGEVLCVVVHDRAGYRFSSAGVVIAGHTHRPSITRSHGTLHVNPGSARLSRAPSHGESVALLRVEGGRPQARIVSL